MSGRALQKLIGGRFSDWAIPSMLALFLMQALAYADSSSSEALSNDGIKRALLIGINKYQVPGADLQGCVNDVKNLSGVLTTYYGFADKDITTLTDAQGRFRVCSTVPLGDYAFVLGVRKPGYRDTVFDAFPGWDGQTEPFAVKLIRN